MVQIFPVSAYHWRLPQCQITGGIAKPPEYSNFRYALIVLGSDDPVLLLFLQSLEIRHRRQKCTM